MSQPRPVAVIVLAAGEGTRMRSRIPKVLHSLCGRSMLGHALAAAAGLGPERLVVVTGHGRDEVSAEAAEIQGVNDRVQLAQAQRACNGRLLEDWMRAGITIMDPSSTWMDVDVTLAPDAEVLPGTHLEGRTDIGTGARIGPDCLLRDTSVGQDATVLYSVCESAEIGPARASGRTPGCARAPGSARGRTSAPTWS